MKKYLKMIGYILLFSAVYFVFNKLAGLVYFGMLGNLVFLGKPLMMNAALFHIFQDAIQIPFFLLIFKYMKKQSLIKVCKFKPIDKTTLMVVIVLGLCTSFFTGSLIRIPWAAQAMPGVVMILNDNLLSQHPLQFIFWVIIHAGLYREILYRGILFNEYRTALPVSVAMSLQGFMYGFLFFGFRNPELIFYSFLTCVVFGLVYVWCDSIVAAIVMQISSFTGLYLLKHFGDYFLKGEVLAYVIGIILIVITAGMMYLKEQYDQKKKLNESDSEDADKNSSGAVELKVG